MVIWWGMIYKCEYFITLCLYHKVAYKVLSTVKKTEGMRATRRRRSTLKSHLLRWAPAAPVVATPKVLGGQGCKPPLSLVKNICVCTSCVVSGAVSAAKGFGGVSHDFRCILCHLLGARPAMGLRIGWGSPHCLSLISALPLQSHVNLLSESNFSKTSFLSESVDDGGTYLNDSSTNLKVLDLVLKQQWSNGNSI